MENRSLPIGFIIKQVNNVYEKDLNERLKKIGITSSQCAVLDYLFHTSKDANDRRKKIIYLTEKAYDIRRKMEADRRKLDRELTRGMTKRETEALRKNLDKILNNIADP